jgi:hypothetical protein
MGVFGLKADFSVVNSKASRANQRQISPIRLRPSTTAEQRKAQTPEDFDVIEIRRIRSSTESVANGRSGHHAHPPGVYLSR